ncbi:MAG: TIGR04372 family glycosyltransferase [Solidesulfovibrio sp.]
MSKRTLIIGTAKQEHIRNCVEATAATDPDTQISLLLLERERDNFKTDAPVAPSRIHYFKRPILPLSPPLLYALFTERPDSIIIVCGLYYDHDNVVCAVQSICNEFLRNAQLSVFVQQDRCATPPLCHSPLWLHLLTWLVHLFIAATIRLLSPVTTVRAGDIFSTRIGHLAYDCEIYLCEKELGYHNGCFDLHYLKDNQTANQTLYTLFARKLRITRFARLVHEAILRFHLDKHELKLVTRRLGTARDPECLIPATPVHIAFTKEEHACARQEMRKLGIPQQQRYVCLLGRDSSYLEWIKPFQSDSNLQEPRNIDINDYRLTASTLADTGYTVLRMGSKVKASLVSDRKYIIDYATHPDRSDFMDVYLSATCSFFIGSGSGLQEVPVIFRTPCILINGFQLELLQTCSPKNILLPQIIYDNELRRVLRVDEVLARKMGDWGVERFAQSTRITLIRNTPEEIQEAATEMHQRLEGTWQEDQDDVALQQRFWGLFKPSAYNRCFAARIGARFLRRHAAALLPDNPDKP